MNAARRIGMPFIVILAVGPGPASASPPPPEPAKPAAPAEDKFANNACVRCHENLPGRLGEIVSLEWRHSVHHDNSVGCDGCHGGDASLRAEQFPDAEAFKQASHLSRDARFLAMTQATGQFVNRVRGREVSYFCGKCHALVKEKHLGSPHGDNGDPTCLYCHARSPEGRVTHRIEHASLDIIDPRSRDQGGLCSPCHQAPTMQAVSQIKATLARTTALIDEASEQYEGLTKKGYRSLELATLQQHGQEVQSRLRRVFHSFDMREINGFAGEIQALSERTTRTHDLLEQVGRMRRRQAMVGLGIAGFLLCFAGLLLHYKRTYCLEHAAPPGTHAH